MTARTNDQSGSPKRLKRGAAAGVLAALLASSAVVAHAESAIIEPAKAKPIRILIRPSSREAI